MKPHANDKHTDTMNISVFCGASLPRSEQITEAARQLGRAIARVRTLAERTFKKMQTAFSDVSHLQESKGIDGLFGCEVLAKQRLLISYKRQELILID